MKRFVKAVGGMKHTVIYTDADERHFRFSEALGLGEIIIQGMFMLDLSAQDTIE